MRATIIPFILLLGLHPLSAQSSDSVVRQVRATPADFATVYVYRSDKDYVPKWFYTWNLTVFFGAQPDAKGDLPRLARVKTNRYFVMQVPAGKYFFDTHRMKYNLPVEFTAGTEYYFRLDAGKDCGVDDGSDPTFNCTDRWPSIEAVDIATGRAALAKVTLIGSDNVKDKRFVALPRN